MYEEHYCFEPPDKDSTTVWKYLKFQYFISLLDKNSFFFAKPELFEDPYEGSYSNANLTEMNALLEKYDENSIIAQNIRTLLKSSKKETDNVVLNCWHMNKEESAAMWKLYSDDNAGISIKSDFGRLKNCFSECPYPVYIGKVKYIDWNLEKIPQQNVFSPYLHKRRSFEHENEIRALVYTVRRDGEICYIDKNQVLQNHEFTNDGIYVPISLNILIEKIYVSPKSSKWFLDLVKSISKMYGLNKEIIRSNLYDGPS
jgi:Protein of unknown function (DUF2971)